MGQPALRGKQFWIGIILTLVAGSILVCTQLWMRSRTFVALNRPVSLAKGRISSGPFRINLRNYYEVKIETGWESYFDPNCLHYERVRARWMLYKDGTILLHWIDSPTSYGFLGDFIGDVGTYELDVDVVADAACLNPGHPRLVVFTDSGEYEDRTAWVSWIAGIGVALGASLALLAFLATKSDATRLRISDSENVTQSVQWAQKLPLKATFISPPQFALIAAPCLMIVMIIFMVLLQPYPSIGLYVGLLRPGQTAGDEEPLSDPIVVHIVDIGPGVTPRFDINSRVSSWGNFQKDLRDQLKLRPKWTVYVESDPNLPWGTVANVIDLAKGLHARVKLVTTPPSH